MAERHADIAARITLVGQLQAVVTAMRGIAAARAQHGRSLIPGIDAYARLVVDAIDRAALAPSGHDAPPQGPRRSALIAFCAEEGFAGAFSERVLDAAAADPDDVLIVVGTRGAAIARERGMRPDDVARLPSHADQIEGLADALLDKVFAILAPGEISRLDVVFGRQQPNGSVMAERRSILPLDPDATRTPPNAAPPMTTIPPAALLEQLATEYVFAALCWTGMHAYVAENEARLRAMAAARNNIEQRLTALAMTEKALRQEEITSEIIEIVAGAEAARRSPAA